jgi:hypothetical protein
MADAPPFHGFNHYDDSNWPDPILGPGPTLSQQAITAAQHGANTLRMGFGIRWDLLNPSPGFYDYSQFGPIINALTAARNATGRSNIKAVLIFVGPVPDWVVNQYGLLQVGYGYTEGGRTRYWAPVASGAGTDALAAFGGAVSQSLLYMNTYADLVEIYNEPNAFDGVHPVIAPSAYGDLAAYAAYWVYNCVQNSNIYNANAHVLAGALSCAANAAYDYLTYFGQFSSQLCTRLVSLNSGTYATINSDVRISCHPYPEMNEPNTGVAYGTVTSKVANLISAGSNTPRKYWVTETAASSFRLGDAGQGTFAQVVSQYLGGNSAVEGMLWWPLNDWDPRAREANQTVDRFAGTGVMTRAGVNKPAGTWFAGHW